MSKLRKLLSFYGCELWNVESCYGNWKTRRQTNSPTTKSPTDQLADTPTRRQTNSPKMIYGHFGTWTCLFGSWTLRPQAGRFSQSLKPRSDWQVSGARKKNAILSTHSRSAHNVANRKRYFIYRAVKT